MRRLQDVALQQEREKLQQQQVAWTQEKQLMEKELRLHAEKVRIPKVCPPLRLPLTLPVWVLLQVIHVLALEAELSGVALKLRWSEEDKTRLLGESEEQRNKVSRLLLRFFTWGTEDTTEAQPTRDSLVM